MISCFDMRNEFIVATGKVLFAGGAAATNASGLLVRASDAGAVKAVGAACADVAADAPAGTLLEIKQGINIWNNGGSFTEADRWAPAYFSDDNTVSKAATGLFAGWVYKVDGNGVWVTTVPELGGLYGGGAARVVDGGAAATVASGVDTTVLTATDNAVITLPLVSSANRGQRVKVQFSGADGAAKVSISPNALNAIYGTIANALADAVSGNVLDKDWILTKATSNKGDYTILESDGAVGWYIGGGVGIWASEP